MKFMNNLMHAQTVDTRPFSRVGRGLSGDEAIPGRPVM